MTLRVSQIAGAFLIGVIAAASIAWAQRQAWTPLTEPTVVSGPDVGFRVDWMNGRTPTGKIVIRIQGQWVEARIGEPGDRFAVPPPPEPPPPPPPPPR